MKVYLSGSHGSGKSTLCRHISQKYNIPMIFETARQILSQEELQIDTLRCDINVANKYQQQVFDRQLIEEQKHASFVSDRSLIDILAYTAQHSSILPELLIRPELKPYIESLKLPGVFVFWVRPCKATLRADGVREVLNWDGSIQIDAMVKFMFQMWNIPHIQIGTENMQERISLIENVLSLAK